MHLLKAILFSFLFLLASCSLFSGSDEKLFKSDFTIDLTTVADSVGVPDSIVAYLVLNTKDSDTVILHSSSYLGKTAPFVFETHRKDSVSVTYYAMLAGKAIAGNQTSFVQGDSVINGLTPYIAPGISFVSYDANIEISKAWNPALKIHNITGQSLKASLDYNGDGNWDITSNPDYLQVTFTKAGTYTMYVRVFDLYGLEGRDTTQIVISE